MNEYRDCAKWDLVTASGYPLEIKVALGKLDGTWEMDVAYRGQRWYVGVGKVEDWEAQGKEVQAALVTFCEGQDETLDLAALVGVEV